QICEPIDNPTWVTVPVSSSGATGIACADAIPRPIAKAIEAKSFMRLPPGPEDNSRFTECSMNAGHSIGIERRSDGAVDLSTKLPLRLQPDLYKAADGLGAAASIKLADEK
ncbi:hypothetical protein, partial [Nitrobacter sp.]|uniref:hypothetical protein n=1 Tax=Nitrobacter sp. TaxID=29420 RepID=UPI0025CC6851